MSNHLLSIVFRFHDHSQKVIGSLGIVKTEWMMHPFGGVFSRACWDDFFFKGIRFPVAGRKGG